MLIVGKIYELRSWLDNPRVRVTRIFKNGLGEKFIETVGCPGDERIGDPILYTEQEFLKEALEELG